MEIKKDMQDALNEQFKQEYYANYLYLSMSTWFEAENLSGMAGWMRKQAEEEVKHAMKFYNFINERAGRVILGAIDKPKSDWKSPLDVFEDAYAHEKKVSAMIYDLYRKAMKDEDFATKNFLEWFLDEQVEEEDQTLTIVDTLKKIGDSVNGLIMFDRELGKRD
ncbi:MAG: ferritin [Acidobacteria bacterium]|nr:ferritin [Acidobacteriota bacterium]